MSIRASKEAVMRGLDEPSLEAAIRGQSALSSGRRPAPSDDFVEGPRAFAEKRAAEVERAAERRFRRRSGREPALTAGAS